MTRDDFDAVVVGGGPAGSSAAILLARAGWRVALVEKHRFPRRKVCGECIAVSNLPLLEALGIGADLRAHAGPMLSRVVLMHERESVIACLPAARSDAHRFGLALGREFLDTSLRDRAAQAGVHVFQPWSVESIDGEPGAWSCAIRAVGSHDRATLRARVAIDAHGSWEALPAARSARPRPKRRSDLFAFKANFRGASLPGGAIVVVAFAGGYGGMVVAGDGVTTVACCIRRDRLAACRNRFAGDAGEAVQAFLALECAGVREALSGASRDGPWLASGPIDPGVHRPRPEDPFRIGNAAGEAHPIVGEGMSMALQSAWLLYGRLIGSEDRSVPPDGARQRVLGAAFARDWRRQFGRRLRVASLFAHAAMRPASAAWLVRIARRWPRVLTLGAEWAGKSVSVVDPDDVTSLLSASAGSIAVTPRAAPRVVADASTPGT